MKKSYEQIENEVKEDIRRFGLNNYEVCKDNDGYAESSEYYAWWFFPDLIEFHQKIRNETNILLTINISILINSAIIVEGFLYELLKQSISFEILKDDLLNRMFDDLNKRIDKSTWSDLINLYRLISNVNLQEITTQENWKSISYLFQTRNMLTHSKPVKFIINVIDNEPKMRHFDKYENVYKFLIEKRLIEKIDFRKTLETNLINSNVADFFWNESKVFIKNVMESDPKYKDMPINYTYTNIFK